MASIGVNRKSTLRKEVLNLWDKVPMTMLLITTFEKGEGDVTNTS